MASKFKRLMARLRAEKQKYAREPVPETPAAKSKIHKTMKEFKEGELRSGSKEGPKVTDPKQAVAIALSQARKKG